MTERLVEFRLCSEKAKNTAELCSHCGKHPVIAGKHYCKSCLAEMKKQHPHIIYKGKTVLITAPVSCKFKTGGSHE